MESYVNYHRQLLVELQRAITPLPPFNLVPQTEEDAAFLQALDKLCGNPNAVDDEQQHIGQLLITTIVARYPHITPMVPRDLFWFFGGDCLHFLGEEEVVLFQQLDENYHELMLADPANADYGKLRTSATASQSQRLN